MDFPHLYSNDIYPIPYEDGYLLYAPLSELIFRLGHDDMIRIERYLCAENDDAEIAELVKYIRSEIKTKRTIPAKDNVGQLHKLTILPTLKCNFHCSYCYSAQGRDNKTITEKMALGVIDYFIDRKRTNLDDLWLAILGGGEPFLTPQLTARIIEYSTNRAKQQGFRLGIGLTTNGSLYDSQLSKVMVANNVNLGVSFEVLKVIQESQRQDFDKVVPVVQRYMDEGVDITIKSIITPANVCRLEEMVKQMHHLFPKVKKYKLQIVEDPRLFEDRGVMIRFYNDFTLNFFAARSLGYSLGVDVYVLASKYVEMLVEHYCGGEMCLNPEGTITVCHRYSSHKEQGYSAFVYGSVDDDGSVTVDDDRFAELISHDSAHQDKCKDCIAKWHCGGGCLAQSSIYATDQLDIICQWTRQFTKEIIVRKYNKLTNDSR